MLIKNIDYERIYRVINSIIKNEDGDPSMQCILFSVYGAAILSSKYNLDATPKAGIAAFHLGIPDRLIFAKNLNGAISCESDGFHCWVEVDGWIIDFMAPAFSKLPMGDNAIPAKMFQKPLSDMASSINELNKSGDYFLKHSPEITKTCLHGISTKVAYTDLAQICLDWYKRPPKIIKNSIFIGDQDGQQKRVRLSGETLVGNW